MDDLWYVGGVVGLAMGLISGVYRVPLMMFALSVKTRVYPRRDFVDQVVDGPSEIAERVLLLELRAIHFLALLIGAAFEHLSSINGSGLALWCLGSGWAATIWPLSGGPALTVLAVPVGGDTSAGPTVIIP